MGFAQRLRDGDLLLGTLLTLPSPEVAEMVSHCGVDWLFLDGEHGAASILDWQRMLQAAGGRCAGVLRIPECSERAVKKALDVGADGIIAPMVNTAGQARDLVRWSRYPPRGQRGVGLARAQTYGLGFADYLAAANDRVALIVQAEHAEAVEHIDSILAVGDIDAVFVGPYDLSASMGLTGQVGHPDVLAAIEEVGHACAARGVAAGIFGLGVEQVRPWIGKGFRLICAGTDAGFITGGVLGTMAALRP